MNGKKCGTTSLQLKKMIAKILNDKLTESNNSLTIIIIMFYLIIIITWLPSHLLSNFLILFQIIIFHLPLSLPSVTSPSTFIHTSFSPYLFTTTPLFPFIHHHHQQQVKPPTSNIQLENGAPSKDQS